MVAHNTPPNAPATTEKEARSSSSRRLGVFFSALTALCVLSAIGLFSWDNPMPFASEGWFLVANMRLEAIVVIAVAAVCQSVATVAFQTVTNNRIISPSIMGFESLYKVIQTSLVFFLGISGVEVIDGPFAFLAQAALMVAFSVTLYTWLLSGKLANLHIMLLVGMIIGAGLGSLSTFMQRMMDPSTYDVLTARLFGNIANADTTNLTITVPIVAVATTAVLLRSRKLNVLSLGKDTAINLGIDYLKELKIILFLVAILMAMTTSLVGPMTFLGFFIATLSYSLTDTYDHRVIFPAAILLGFSVLCSAYFILRHIFYAGGTVTVIIELIGGLTFLIVVLRKGRL